MCLAVPGRIVAIAAGLNAAGMAAVERPAPDSPADADLWRMATVDFGGVRQPVSLACLPEARLGDLVLVHVGLAICRVEESLLELMEEPIAESMAPRLLETRPDQPEAATLGSTATRPTPRPHPHAHTHAVPFPVPPLPHSHRPSTMSPLVFCHPPSNPPTHPPSSICLSL
jgi:hydrogenase expression/formation protein HypC